MLLTVEGIDTGYGRLQVLHGLSLSVSEGEIVTILGPNGTGKTTLLRAVSGMLPIWSGRVTFDGRDLRGAPPERRASYGMSQLPEGRGIFQKLSVSENLEVGSVGRRGRARHGLKEDRERVLDLFPDLGGRLGARAGSLSGGQQQMLALARSLVARPRMLLIDELSFGLAPRIVSELLQVIKDLRGDGITFLLVEQQAVVLSISDRTYLLRDGANVFDGPSEELLNSQDLVSAYLRG